MFSDFASDWGCGQAGSGAEVATLSRAEKRGFNGAEGTSLEKRGCNGVFACSWKPEESVLTLG